MEFASNIESISEDQLNSLFNGSATVPATEEKPAVSEEGKPAEKKQARVEESGIPNVDLDDLFKQQEEKKETSEEEKKTEEPAKEEEEKPAEEEKKEEEKEEAPQEEQINAVLKSTVDYLVDKGYLKDFEGRDTLEINDDVYADLITKQLDDKVSDLFDELIDSTGDYGKAIINHIKVGGNPDDIIDLFKEQKKIESFDISDKKGQTSLVKKYYSEVIGWKDSKIDSYLATLEGSEDGLEEEAKEVQAKYDEVHQQQLETIRRENERVEKEQKAAVAARKKEQQEYVNNLVKAIDTYEIFDEKDKKLVKDSILKFDKKLSDGTPINAFFNKFYEIQKDPKEYIKLIHFVMDRQTYDKKVQVEQKNKDAEQTWKFVKKNASINKKGTFEEGKPKETKQGSAFDFSKALNKK